MRTEDLRGDEDAPVRLAIPLEIVDGIGKSLFERGKVFERNLSSKHTSASEKIKVRKPMRGVVATYLDQAEFGVPHQNNRESLNIAAKGAVPDT